MTKRILSLTIPTMSRSANWLSFATLVIIFSLGCGSTGSMPPPPPPINITITPAAATITLYSSVDLALTGFVQGTNVTWSVEKDSSCNVENPFYPQPSCPDGWLYQMYFPNVTYYAPVTPGTYNVYADWKWVSPTGSETGQSMATITVTPVNPSVDVTGAWSGTLTQTNVGPPPVQYPATLDLSQDSTGVITGTLISPVLEAAPCLVGDNTSLPMTGYVDGTNMYVFGSNESEAVVATINAAADPSGQQLNGTVGMYQGNLDHPVCPAPYGTIVLTKQ